MNFLSLDPEFICPALKRHFIPAPVSGAFPMSEALCLTDNFHLVFIITAWQCSYFSPQVVHKLSNLPRVTQLVSDSQDSKVCPLTFYSKIQAPSRVMASNYFSHNLLGILPKTCLEPSCSEPFQTCNWLSLSVWRCICWLDLNSLSI